MTNVRENYIDEASVGKDYDKLSISDGTTSFREHCVSVFSRIRSARRLLLKLSRSTFEMLPKDNVLRIIAKFTAKQIDATYVRGVTLDPNPHRDRLTEF